MAIGGFNNEGGNLYAGAVRAYVAQGEIHYYIASGSGGAVAAPAPAGAVRRGAGSSSTSSISSWVEAHFKSVKIGGQTVYDLTQAVS